MEVLGEKTYFVTVVFVIFNQIVKICFVLYSAGLSMGELCSRPYTKLRENF